MRAGVVLAVVVAITHAACGPSGGGDGEPAGESSGDTSSGGAVADLPPEPECQNGLGDVVSCDCAIVRQCSLSSTDSSECAPTCDLPTPCPDVVCSFDGSVSGLGCDMDVDEAALDCVFDALAAGEPMAWAMEVQNTYTFVGETQRVTHHRLDERAYLRGTSYRYSNDVGESRSSWSYSGLHASSAMWMVCEDIASLTDRFECLMDLAGEACADPAALVCPESG